MATATFIQQGIAIDYRPNADVATGTVVVLNDLVGVAVQSIKANQLGSLAVEGVFWFPKAQGFAIQQGEITQWDVNQDLVNLWNSGSTFLAFGKAAAAAATNDTKVRVRLSQ